MNRVLIKSRFYATTIVAISFFLLFATQVFAFTCHRETRGPITFEISKIAPLSVEGKFYTAPLIVKNDSSFPISVKGKISSLDTVYLSSDPNDNSQVKTFPDFIEMNFTVEPNSTYNDVVAFSVRGAYRDAHYPLRADFTYELDGKTEIVQLRPVFATQLTEFLPNTKTLQIKRLKAKSFLRLSELSETNYAPYWKKFDGEFTQLAIGWTGVESHVKCSFNPCSMSRNGVNRSSWSIHPPYAEGSGVFGLRFVVSLPESKEIQLRLFRAMRDVFAPEPPTDGVVFRVYVTPIALKGQEISKETLDQFLSKSPDPQTIVLNEQYSGTNWSEANVDLSSYSSQTVLLTFEADPGTKRDTTCDNSFWGDVTLIADPQNVSLVNEKDREELQKTNINLFEQFVKQTADAATPSSGIQLKEHSHGFNLGDNQFAVVTLGKYGICDGWISIGSPERYVQIDGVRARYQGVNVGFDKPLASCNVSASFVEKDNLEKLARIFAYQRQSTIIGDLPVDANFSETDLLNVEVQSNPNNELTCFISQTDGGLAFRFVATNNTEIESLQFGPTSQKANRVYFGHGHCIEKPSRPFTQDGDGFGCASSHVGFDFENGVSLLQATTRPIENFVVNPELNVYTLTTRPDSRLTLRSSDKGALHCAIQYAPGFDKKPALLVNKKAGRFVFDFWGGSYAHVLERIKTFVDYGLTDSLLIQHCWQHYGYDVRLPDIWPPKEDQGTLEELKATQEFCDKIGIPFGLHDNYIDFYPDADGFTYNDIIMNSDGLPQKAWYNPGPDVQSYRFQPNAIFPYAERNLNLIRQDLMQTAYFTDVFSSIHIMDYYDRQGKFHSRAETLDCWNKYFDLVHEKFNNNAITISESGNDALIGHLDGADAILRRITPTQENYSTVIACDDSEYVPWFDAVNHKRFILHGVGYSDRYQGGISRALRGIESDDYLSSEVLTGHALMSDLGMSIRGTVRKYWLLQNFARSLALDELVDVEFIDNDIHRQKITWKSGEIVYVNRGVKDWTLSQFNLPNTSQLVVLPQFGFWTVGKDGKNYGGVVKQADQVIELRVDGTNSFFVNGRQLVPNQVTPIRPTYENVQVTDGKTISGKLVWNAIQPTDAPYVPFLHLERPQTWWNDKPKLHVLPLDRPNKSSDTWNGRETDLFGDKVTVTVPDNLDSGYYNLLCGLFDPKTGRRLQLLGSGTYDARYRLGSIIVEGQGEERKLTFVPAPDLHGIDLRLVSNQKPSQFGVCSTLGAFRLEQKSDNSVTLTPLPEEPAFEVVLQTEFFQHGSFIVIGRDQNGNEVSRTETSSDNSGVSLTIDASQAFSFEIIKQ